MSGTDTGYKLERPLEELVLYDKPTNEIARITLNRPEKHNAMWIPDSFSQFYKRMEAAIEDQDVKVIIVRGNGPSFCVGDDLNRPPYAAFGGKPGYRPSQAERLSGFRKGFEENFRPFMFCPKTVIVQTHGTVMGWGMCVVMGSDLVIASEDTRFSHAELRIGFGGLEDTLTLMSILTVGLKRAREWALTGRTLTANEAKEWGVVNAVVPREKLEDETLKWAKAICLHSADGLMITKTFLQLHYEMLGIGASFPASVLAHTLFTNLKWREHEMNFLKLSDKEGLREAFRKRDDQWKEYGF